MLITKEKDIYEIGNVPVTELAKKYGTPLYAYNWNKISRQINRVFNEMNGSVKLFYSLKANPNLSIVKRIYESGVNLEICSPLELKICQKIGASPDRLLYLGPGKTENEIREIISFGIKHLVVESLQEIELVNQIAQEFGRNIKVGLRINPEHSAKGSKLTMGGKPRQFGMDEDQLAYIFNEIHSKYEFIQVVGLHVYNGTRILSHEVLIENTKHVLNLATDFLNVYQINLEYVDIGGGMGIPYFKNEDPLNFEEAAVGMNKLIEDFQQKSPYPIPIFLESGRFITGESGVYVTKTLYIKESKGVKFATADGGTNHHMAAGGMGNALKKNFPITVLNKMNVEPTEKYNISGPLCTPNDIIGRGVELPVLEQGDLLGILNSGAYGLTSSPVLFLSHGLPVEVLIDGKEVTVIREKHEYDLSSSNN
ncbi:diaminopimelate decarboxylase [Priestia koreensis]|uniref:diaminopimelate decarboxylase n=1 Tax=Priestia koreensis TaxID=284581 RepID=UPI003D05795D